MKGVARVWAAGEVERLRAMWVAGESGTSRQVFSMRRRVGLSARPMGGAHPGGAHPGGAHPGGAGPQPGPQQGARPAPRHGPQHAQRPGRSHDPLPAGHPDTWGLISGEPFPGQGRDVSHG